jgi:hypothetical protein
LGRLRTALIAAISLAVLAACAHEPVQQITAAPPRPPTCDALSQHATAELVFARVSSDRPGSGVSEADFSRFLSDQIAPRFHDGLTVIDAQNLSPRPADVYGPAKVVMIVLPGRPDDAAQLEAIRAAYKGRFNQQSVLEMTHQDCVSD